MSRHYRSNDDAGIWMINLILVTMLGLMIYCVVGVVKDRLDEAQRIEQHQLLKGY